MKWEILKGSKKDFEGAPEWATRVLRDNNDSKKSFVGELDGVSLVAAQVSPHSWWKFNEGYVANIIAERRPITEPDVNQQLTTEWSGDGLPPAGVGCEIKRVFDWVPVIIKYISGYYTVTQAPDGTEQAYQTSALQFRPIRSPEDVARNNALYALEWLNIDSDVTVSIYEAIAAGKIPGVKLE